MYNRKWAPDTCAAGLVVCCSKTGRFVSGSFAEVSASAISYRGEQLGLLAIYLLLHAVELQFDGAGATNDVFCDNKGAITTFLSEAKHVPSGKKNADIARVLRRVKGRMNNKLRPLHVRAHQDDHTDMSKLSLEARLNCHCDGLAKLAIHEWMCKDKGGWGRLPMEAAALMVSQKPLHEDAERPWTASRKQTSDLGPDL